MYIQINHAGFQNKGAALMLYSIIDRLSQEENLKPKFVFGQKWQEEEDARKLGLFQLFEVSRGKIPLHNIIGQDILDYYGLVTSRRVNVLLDASGLRFTDKFADNLDKTSLKKFQNNLKTHIKNGTKIIYLPQAFGPVENPLVKEQIKILHEYSLKIYPRDIQSLNYVNDVIGSSPKVKLAPDFTCLFNKVDLPHIIHQQTSNRICIIPNSKMLTHSSPEITENYLSFLHRIISFLLKQKQKITLLNHEGENDRKLINDITSSIQSSIQSNDDIIVLNQLSAPLVKGVINNSKLVISSRFHGVVSGLNQKTPTLCTSWSHKYEELLNDYSLKNSLLNPINYNQSEEIIADALENPYKYISTDSIIENTKKNSEAMWEEIIQIIK